MGFSLKGGYVIMFVYPVDFTSNTSWISSSPCKLSLFNRSKVSFFSHLPRRISMVRGEHRIREGRLRHEQVATETTGLIRPASLSLKETWSFVHPYIIPSSLRLRLVAAISLVCVLLKKIVSLLPPYAFKLAVDSLTADITDGTETVPLLALIAFLAARLVSAFLNGAQEYCYAHVSVNNTRRFAVNVFDHLQNLSLAFHLQRKTGEITRIMDRGVGSIDNLTSTFLFTLLPIFFEAVLVTAIFVKLGIPSIAITTLVTVAGYFVYTYVFTSWRIKLRRLVIESDNRVSSKAVDTLMNYETVKMFGMEHEEVDGYDLLRRDYQGKYLSLRRTLVMLNFGQSAIQTTGLGICVIIAAFSAAKGLLTPGDFVLVNYYVMQLFQPLFFLGTVYRQITQNATDLEKCINLFKERITVVDKPEAKPLSLSEEDIIKGRAGEVCFDQVLFKYHGGERSESGGLRNISFHVPPGKMIAFVGASGAGKSTIMRLLLRFYDVDNGAVMIDGVDVRELTQTSLRKNVGVVAQDTILFNATLRDNISYGKPEASDLEIMNAARSAALGPLIESLPLGLDTVVGERGVRLSGGERQRVGCARCVIKNPAIMLLDEATSSLDTRTEREVQANLREVCKNRTTLVVAHRLSTIMMSDEIVVLAKDAKDGSGTIVERGSHEELIRLEGVYADMWRAQTSVEYQVDEDGMLLQ